MELICLGIFVMHCTQIKASALTGDARFCEVAEPWCVRRSDHPETREQARRHNAQGLAICSTYEKWKPPYKCGPVAPSQ